MMMMMMIMIMMMNTWWEGILCYWLLWDIALISFCNYKKSKKTWRKSFLNLCNNCELKDTH